MICNKFLYLCNGIRVGSVKVFYHIAICIFPAVVSVVNVWHFIRSGWTRTKVFKWSRPAGCINGYPCYLGDIYILKKKDFIRLWFWVNNCFTIMFYNDIMYYLICKCWSRSGIVSKSEYSNGDSHVTNSQSNLSANDVIIIIIIINSLFLIKGPM